MSRKLILLILFPFQIALAQSGNNELIGKVTMPEVKPFIKKGDMYNKDGSKVMHSRDRMAHPNNNVIISLHPRSKSVKPEIKPTPNAVVTQKEQTFIPAVLPVTKGSIVTFRNEDEINHSVLSYTQRNINLGKKPPGEDHSRTIKKKGVIKLNCNIHSHMRGVILSFETPYFTRVSPNGDYHLKDLPDGTYRIEVFHLDAGKLKEEVILKGGQIVQKDFDLTKA